VLGLLLLLLNFVIVPTIFFWLVIDNAKRFTQKSRINLMLIDCFHIVGLVQ
jgi:hypothetical protein